MRTAESAAVRAEARTAACAGEGDSKPVDVGGEATVRCNWLWLWPLAAYSAAKEECPSTSSALSPLLLLTSSSSSSMPSYSAAVLSGGSFRL